MPSKVTISKPFAATIRKCSDGITNSLVVKHKLWYQNELNKFRDGEEVTLEVHTKKVKRTEQQNRYLWGVFYPLVAQKTGELNIDRLHELFKGLFLTEGVVEVLGKKVRMKKSTTELSVADFCQYILAIEQETGVQAPPTENWGLAPLK